MRSLTPVVCSYQRLGLSALWGVLALAAPVSVMASVEDCDAYSQADRLTCLGKAATASEIELTQARSALASAIDRWDEDAKYKAAAKRQLDAADYAFAKHRTARRMIKPVKIQSKILIHEASLCTCSFWPCSFSRGSGAFVYLLQE